MTEKEIIIANLRAQVLIETARASALRQWSLNMNHQLQASVCEATVKELSKKISLLTK